MKKIKSIILLAVMSILLVSCEEEESSLNDLVTFGFDGIEVSGSILDRTVEVYLPEGSDLSNLTPHGEISKKSIITPAFLVPYDFTVAKVFTIIAENGNEKEYTITAIIGTPTAKSTNATQWVK